MEDIRCAACGKSHDLSELEPSFDRPDAYFAIAESERATRSLNTNGLCAIRGAGADPLRCFVRVVLPVPVRGESRQFRWGVWAEVSEADFVMLGDNWESPDQASMPPFQGRLANEIPFMPGVVAPTLDLPGKVQPTGPRDYPEFMLDESLEHPFAVEQREGIYAERLLEYLSPGLHDS